ncbi:MAG: GNAT family N-acetyltransferase [Nanoarchaeota archaeon]
MDIRIATKHDASGIAQVLVSFLNIKTQEEAEQTFLQEMEKHHRYLIAVDNGQIIGLVSWVMHGRPKHGLYELYHIGLLPQYFGTGVAQQLYTSMEVDAQAFFESHGSKARKLIIMTHDTNARAHRFYEKMGAKKEAVLPRHYYDDKDEHVFSKYY